MSSKLARLQEEAQAAVKTAREIAEKVAADGKSLSDPALASEKSTYDEAMAKGRDLLDQIKVAKADEAVLNDAKAMAEAIGMPQSAVDDIEAQKDDISNVKTRVKSLGLQVVESPQFQSLIKGFGGRIPDGSRVQSDPIPVKLDPRRKSLFTGASDTSGGAFVVADQSGIVEMLGRAPLTLRSVISVRRTTSDTVEYVQQTSHTNAAAPVAEATSSALPTQDGSTGPLVQNAGGGYKPEGAWAFERVTATVKTIAEWVPASKRALADVAQLEGLINDELNNDLAETEEDEIVNGSGSGEHLPGLLHTSGTQSQAFDTDIFVTVRKAKTKARTVGRVIPNGVLMNPEDVETVDLSRDANDRFYGNGPFSMGPNTLWGMPIVESEAVDAGTAIVADFKKAVLWDREQSSITVSDSHADFFIRNLVAVLGEERVAFGVTRPKAVVVTDVAA